VVVEKVIYVELEAKLLQREYDYITSTCMCL